MALYGSKNFHVINKDLPRVDGVDKVTGRAKYAADISFPGMLVAGSLYAWHAHAEIIRLDTTRAKAVPGVRAVLTARDMPTMESMLGRYRFVTDKVRYVGDVMAIVAAEDEVALKAGLEAIEVEYRDLPAVLTIEEALAPGAPQVHEKGVGLVDGIPTAGTRGNIFLESYNPLRKGDVEQGFRESDVILETEYRTQFVEHAYIEPEAVVAVYDSHDGLMTVHSSSQHPHSTRRWVAYALQIPQNKVRVVQRTVGGSFGGKEESVGLIAGRAAVLARVTGRPVRLVLSREESIIESGKRHPFHIKYKVGAKRDGTLMALEATLIDNCGAYNSHAVPMNPRAMIHSAGAYVIPHIKTDTYGVYTNNIHPGAFRGYSSPQVIFCGEQMMEELAQKLGMSIVDLKRKNLLRQGALTATSQRLVQPTLLVDMMEDMLQKTDFIHKREENRNQTGEIRRGIGLSTCYRGCGLGVEHVDSSGAQVTLLSDGTFLINHGLAENGQGLHTAYTQIAAEAIGARVEDVAFVAGDTHAVADSGFTAASRGTVMGGQSMRKAGERMKQLLLETGRELLGARPEEQVDLVDSVCFVVGQPERRVPLSDICARRGALGQQMSVYEWYQPRPLAFDHATGQGEAFPTYCYEVAIAEVSVDTGTGAVTVDKITVAHDLGTVINPGTAMGQIYGGIVMGMGFALMEEVEIDRGIVKSKNLDSYIIPTAMDIPEMDVTLYECDDDQGTYGAKSLGEPATEAIGAAVASAVSDALGRLIKRLPADLERVKLGRALRPGGED